MMQTVTFVAAGVSMDSSALNPLKEHIQAMTSEGWIIVSTDYRDRGGWEGIFIFWRKQ
jgi:hypothetical protein